MAFKAVQKLRKILERPVPPPHIRERNYQVIIPWHKRLWKAIQPPEDPGIYPPLRRSQKVMLGMAGAAVVLAAAAWFVFDYIATAPGRAQAAYDLGMRKLGANDLEGAIADFTRSIETSPTAEAYLQRGNAYAQLGRPEVALEDWARAIAMNLELTEAYTARGAYYRAQGDHQRALADLNRSIAIRPTVEAYYERGQLYHTLGKFPEALQDFDRAIELQPLSPYVYLARAATRRAAGDEAGAEQDQRQVAALQRR
jgi:tetratricopeptide (TPR) repeat protein